MLTIHWGCRRRLRIFGAENVEKISATVQTNGYPLLVMNAAGMVEDISLVDDLGQADCCT